MRIWKRRREGWRSRVEAGVLLQVAPCTEKKSLSQRATKGPPANFLSLVAGRYRRANGYLPLRQNRPPRGQWRTSFCKFSEQKIIFKYFNKKNSEMRGRARAVERAIVGYKWAIYSRGKVGRLGPDNRKSISLSLSDENEMTMAGSGHRRDKRSRSRSQPVHQGLGRLAEVVNSASGPDLFFFRGRRSGGLRLVRLYGSFTQCGASQPVAKVKVGMLLFPPLFLALIYCLGLGIPCGCFRFAFPSCMPILELPPFWFWFFFFLHSSVFAVLFLWWDLGVGRAVPQLILQPNR